MQATLTIKETKPKFQPVTLQITIVNEKDLLILWHRFNLSSGCLDDKYKRDYLLENFGTTKDTQQTWNVLETLRENNRVPHPRRIIS